MSFGSQAGVSRNAENCAIPEIITGKIQALKMTSLTPKYAKQGARIRKLVMEGLCGVRNNNAIRVNRRVYKVKPAGRLLRIRRIECVYHVGP